MQVVQSQSRNHFIWGAAIHDTISRTCQELVKDKSKTIFKENDGWLHVIGLVFLNYYNGPLFERRQVPCMYDSDVRKPKGPIIYIIAKVDEFALLRFITCYLSPKAMNMPIKRFWQMEKWMVLLHCLCMYAVVSPAQNALKNLRKLANWHFIVQA